jgi:hypothetical protein
VSNNDPTDHALATIASILHHPEPHSEPDDTETEIEAEDTPHLGMTEADGYHKVGPGPLAVIRFKWTVRRGSDGGYYVDETIGENSRPVVAGPMSADEAIRLVDDRENESRLRFESLRSEMSGHGPARHMRRDSEQI